MQQLKISTEEMDEIVKDCIGVKVILKSNGTNYLEKFYN
jgi:hypothetical protein